MTKAKVHLITGGQRSGKSEYAEELTLSESSSAVYVATSKVWDDEHKNRINIHIARRGEEWTTIEEEMNISKLKLEGKTVLLDCVTLWLTNIYDAFEYDQKKTLEFAKNQWDEMLMKDMELFVVGNEIGLGVIPMDKGTRSFVDMHGAMNQYIAKSADKVTLMVSGIPMKVK
ncbi:MAG: bifunctional adenosylcobinamide kinase/adenosylcobinamide-phosphate guanylyltransferase [Crocinitomicaceae bacterium]|nr:bifunctional adenosylcobinamide kinase/adenosylcobinamide-phosphate guanylyltransferase [Crocinitomicaceae bacterium]